MLAPKEVEVATLSRGRGRNHAKTEQREQLTSIQQRPGKHVTSMHLCKAIDVEEYTAKTRFAAVKDMAVEACVDFVLQARRMMTYGVAVSECECLLYEEKIQRCIKDLRQFSCKAVTNVIVAS